MHSNECDRCCAVMPSLEQLLLWCLRCFPHNCFSFYISPVNKLHLLHPTTHTLARIYTQPSCQSCKLTFTLQQLTKGHEGPSFKSIYLIWIASVYMEVVWSTECTKVLCCRHHLLFFTLAWGDTVTTDYQLRLTGGTCLLISSGLSS